MSRIIAGSAGGRRLATPSGERTRPTTDRVREALFSRLSAMAGLSGARVLDLYAGTGALGLEAASRGAAHVRCIEADRQVARLAQRNALDLGLAATLVVTRSRVERVLPDGPGDAPYDVVLADPPYPLGQEQVAGVLRGLVQHRWLAEDAVVVLERSSRSPRPDWPDGLVEEGSRSYGETTLHLARADEVPSGPPGPR